MNDKKIIREKRKEILSNTPVPTFPDFVEISSFDTLIEPRYPTMKVMNFLFFKVETICNDCKQLKTFKLTKDKVRGDFFSIKCGCGIDIIYPRSPLRDNRRLWVRITKEQYKSDKHEFGKDRRNT